MRRLLTRCLEKDPRLRLRDIGDAGADLAEGAGANARGTPVRSRAWPGWVVAGLATLAAAVFAVRSPWRAATLSPAPAESPLTVERLTLDSGVSTMPSLSSDGRLLAYASTRSGRGDLDIWVQQTAGGQSLRITDDPADDSDPDLSPDGTQVVFRSDRSVGGAYLASALGGPARLVAPEARGPRFSPDGAAIAYWTGQFRGAAYNTNSAVFVLRLSGGTPTRLLAEFAVARDPTWAPDGRSLLVLAMRTRSASAREPFDWWRVPIDGGAPTRTTILDRPGWRAAYEREQASFGTWWSQDGLLLGIEGTLWSIPIALDSGVPVGEPRRLLYGTSPVGYARQSRDGTVVFSQSTTERVIERTPLTTAATPLPPIRLYTDANPLARRTSVTRDGQVLVFERDTLPAREIWTKDLRTGVQQLALSVTSMYLVNPTVSPDGARIGFTLFGGNEGQAGNEGQVVGMEGGIPKPICKRCEIWGFLGDSRRAVVVTRDGKAIGAIDVLSGQSIDGSPMRAPRGSIDPASRQMIAGWPSGARRARPRRCTSCRLPLAAPSRRRLKSMSQPRQAGRAAGRRIRRSCIYCSTPTAIAACGASGSIRRADGRSGSHMSCGTFTTRRA